MHFPASAVLPKHLFLVSPSAAPQPLPIIMRRALPTIPFLQPSTIKNEGIFLGTNNHSVYSQHKEYKPPRVAPIPFSHPSNIEHPELSLGKNNVKSKFVLHDKHLQIMYLRHHVIVRHVIARHIIVLLCHVDDIHVFVSSCKCYSSAC